MLSLGVLKELKKDEEYKLELYSPASSQLDGYCGTLLEYHSILRGYDYEFQFAGGLRGMNYYEVWVKNNPGPDFEL